MARKRTSRRRRSSVTRIVAVWLGRRMLKRVQRTSLRSITDRPGKPTRSGVSALRKQLGLIEKIRPSAARRAQERPIAASVSGRKSGRGRSTGKGFAVALLSAAAVAAIKVGVDRVVEAERDQQVVTPDFDVFVDDEE